MKKLRLSPIAAAVLALASMSVRAAEIKIIANESVAASSISAAEIKDLFALAKTSLSDGSRAEPVLLKGGPAHEVFVREYLNKTDSALQIYYRSLVFTGKASMPRIATSDAEMAAVVAKTKGAIGYVDVSAEAPGTKTLKVR